MNIDHYFFCISSIQRFYAMYKNLKRAQEVRKVFMAISAEDYQRKGIVPSESVS